MFLLSFSSRCLHGAEVIIEMVQMKLAGSDEGIGSLIKKGKRLFDKVNITKYLTN